MPDLLTFNDTLTLQSLLGTTTLTGTLDVTYGATPSVTGTLTVGAVDGGFDAQTFQSITVSQTGFDSHGVPTYQLLGSNGTTSIAIDYVGMTPTAVSAQLSDAVSTAPLAGATAAPIIAAIVCFVQGTRIRTHRGEVPVERLRVGDKVVTASGRRRPIRWLGSRTIDCRSHPEPRAVLPIRIAADAMGVGLPTSDLYVSPGHGILVPMVDEVLMPASLLCNGSSVQQIDVEAVTYWHVELESHDILFSNGLRSESYIDVGNRAFFHGAEDQRPDGERSAATLAHYCRPYVIDERVVRVVRERLNARAEALGWTLDAAPPSGLHLLVDGKVMLPELENGLTARFVVPAGAADVWVCSDTTIPALVFETWDARRLGISLRGLVVDGRRIPADDPALCVGFYLVEGEAPHAFRWTTGRALLPAALWTGPGATSLEIELAAPALPRWTLQRERPSLQVAA